MRDCKLVQPNISEILIDHISNCIGGDNGPYT